MAEDNIVAELPLPEITTQWFLIKPGDEYVTVFSVVGGKNRYERILWRRFLWMHKWAAETIMKKHNETL